MEHLVLYCFTGTPPPPLGVLVVVYCFTGTTAKDLPVLIYDRVCLLQIHAIMGKNGSGKSTLSKVSCFFFMTYFAVLLLSLSKNMIDFFWVAVMWIMSVCWRFRRDNILE
jgi:hypothetical protein